MDLKRYRVCNMNKIYRVIWNSTLMRWVVTSELGRGKLNVLLPKLEPQWFLAHCCLLPL
ncbi:hypothetical protein CWS02_10590 [Enterobacter sp. EA-1]|nr:hypothetical protein CWS02_10590 [Enterobacter sp. EA-1]